MFSLWLRSLNQTQMVQDACVQQLQVYLVQICTDLFILEETGLRSNWIWMALTNWNYVTYLLGAPSPAHLDLEGALDLANFRNSESSRENILTLFLNNLNDRQRRYLNATSQIIRNQQ